ncbi:MAG: type VII toxin-antitoxin system MntA family adenylyltransferase antitoxin [Bacteroidota bacterium]
MAKSRKIDQITPKLIEYFNKEPSVISVYIFGSFGTELQTPLSDLDIGVLYDGNVPVMEELKQAAEISSLLSIEKIDLINLNKAPVYLQHEILYRGEQIFNRIPERTEDFVENVLEIYHDYQGILKKYREDLKEGLLEDYLNG